MKTQSLPVPGQSAELADDRCKRRAHGAQVRMLLSRVLSGVQECTTSAVCDVSATRAVQGSRGNRRSTDGHPQVGGRPGEEAAGGEAAQPAQARQPLQGDPPHAAQPQRLQCRVPLRVEQHPLRRPAGPRGLQRSFPDSDPYLWSQNPGEEMQGPHVGWCV